MQTIKHQKNHQKSVKRILIGVAATVFLVATIVGWPLFVPTQHQPLSLKLTPTKHIFSPTEKPTLRLHVAKPAHLGFWYTPAAYAAEEPTATITYSDNQKVAVPTTITQDGNDYTVTAEPAPTTTPKAGEYTVTATVPTDDGSKVTTTASFAWGVLAVNSDKTVYAPGETAHLQLAAIDATGHTLCGAPMELTITNPSGASQVTPYNPAQECQGDAYISVPDYTVDYKTTSVGTYGLKLSMKDTDYSVTDSFIVRTAPDFGVERQALSRLNPAHTYGMRLVITPNQDFSGTIAETLPNNSFKIVSAPNANQSPTDTTLTWHVNDWKAGKTYTLGYEYMPPLISPAAYTIKPLQIIHADGSNAFTETRGWQLINDAAITFVQQTATDVTTAATGKTLSVTSSNGNLLVLLVAVDVSGIGQGITAVSDSAGNSWVVPSGNPSQNPPQNQASGTSSVVGMAYATNASPVTSVTVTIASSQRFSMNVLEFTNIDKVNPVMSSSSSSATTALSQTTPNVTVSTCDTASTSVLLRDGNYFCGSDTALVIGIIEAGTATDTLTTSGFTATAAMTPNGSNIHASGAYNILTLASGTYNINWNLSTSKAAGMGIMAFQQQPSGNLKRSLYWAK